MYYLSSKLLSNQSALMINSHLVIKKNNVLLHYKNEFDIQPIKVITTPFPLWRGQGEVKRETNKNYSYPFPLWRGQGEVKRETNKNYSYPFPLWRGQGEVKKEPPMPNIIPYNPKIREFARYLRNNSTLSEVLLWKEIKNKALGVEFKRQVPILDYIVDFYCQELKLAIEVDGHIHDFRYVEDKVRQEQIEQWGITFIRFSNEDIKTNMFSVVLSLESKIDELKKITFSEEQVANTFTQL